MKGIPYLADIKKEDLIKGAPVLYETIQGYAFNYILRAEISDKMEIWLENTNEWVDMVFSPDELKQIKVKYKTKDSSSPIEGEYLTTSEILLNPNDWMTIINNKNLNKELNFSFIPFWFKHRKLSPGTYEAELVEERILELKKIKYPESKHDLLLYTEEEVKELAKKAFYQSSFSTKTYDFNNWWELNKKHKS